MASPPAGATRDPRPPRSQGGSALPEPQAPHPCRRTARRPRHHQAERPARRRRPRRAGLRGSGPQRKAYATSTPSGAPRTSDALAGAAVVDEPLTATAASTWRCSPGPASSDPRWSPARRLSTTPRWRVTGPNGNADGHPHGPAPTCASYRPRTAAAHCVGTSSCTPTTNPRSSREWEQWLKVTRKALARHHLAAPPGTRHAGRAQTPPRPHPLPATTSRQRSNTNNAIELA